MKKDLDEILKIITPESSIEEVASYCDTKEDFELIMKNLLGPESELAHVFTGVKEQKL